MPPYKPVVSTAQRGKLFALAARGEISEDDARGKARAAEGKKLPRYVGGKRPTKRSLGRSRSAARG